MRLLRDTVTQVAAQEEAAEAVTFLTVFLCFIILIGGTIIVYLLRSRHVSWFPEAWVFVLIGLCFSGVAMLTQDAKLSSVLHDLDDSFSPTFFVVLLPPIIFESGYSMDKESFFSNFGAICAYAFLGTFLSTIVVGLLSFWAGSLGIAHAWSLKEALIFGSLVSATDPVTVLAVFQALGVRRRLYALVFGESVINDAVAIVLYHVVLRLQDDFGVADVASGMVLFLINFLGSLFIGLAVGFSGALLFKYTDMSPPSLVNLERALAVLLPFVAYMLAQGLELSGVVAILFAGITSAHYTIKNLTHSARRFSLHFFKVLATVCEALVFVYIGAASPSLFPALLRHSSTFAVTVVAVLVGRVVNVQACTAFVNWRREEAARVSAREQFVLWFSGLRGGVAFALATGTTQVLPPGLGPDLIQATCLFIVMLSIFSIGGSIGPLCNRLELCDPPEVREAERKRREQRRLRQRRWRRRQLTRHRKRRRRRHSGGSGHASAAAVVGTAMTAAVALENSDDDGAIPVAVDADLVPAALTPLTARVSHALGRFVDTVRHTVTGQQPHVAYQRVGTGVDDGDIEMATHSRLSCSSTHAPPSPTPLPPLTASIPPPPLHATPPTSPPPPPPANRADRSHVPAVSPVQGNAGAAYHAQSDGSVAGQGVPVDDTSAGGGDTNGTAAGVARSTQVPDTNDGSGGEPTPDQAPNTDGFAPTSDHAPDTDGFAPTSDHGLDTDECSPTSDHASDADDFGAGEPTSDGAAPDVRPQNGATARRGMQDTGATPTAAPASSPPSDASATSHRVSVLDALSSGLPSWNELDRQVLTPLFTQPSAATVGDLETPTSSEAAFGRPPVTPTTRTRTRT